MKRSPMPRRKTPIKRRATPKRFAARRDPVWAEHIRRLHCLIGWPGCDGPIECDHVKTRGAGGDDQGNTVPLCRTHHSERHRIGIKSFEAKYKIDLRKWAVLLGAVGA